MKTSPVPSFTAPPLAPMRLYNTGSLYHLGFPSVFTLYLPPPLSATSIIIGHGSRGPNHLPRFASASLRFESSVNPMFLWSGLTLILKRVLRGILLEMISESIPLLVCRIARLTRENNNNIDINTNNTYRVRSCASLPGTQLSSLTIWCIPF